MIAVVATTGSGALLPKTGMVAKGAGRTYFFYSVDAAADQRFQDLDGSTLIEIKTFPDMQAARQWAEADVAWRQARPLELVQ
jgi:hypothetical protein